MARAIRSPLGHNVITSGRSPVRSVTRPQCKHERARARFVATSVGFVAAVLRPSLLPARLPTKPRHVFQPRPYFDWNSFSSATSSRNGLSSSAMGSGPSATRASRRASLGSTTLGPVWAANALNQSCSGSRPVGAMSVHPVLPPLVAGALDVSTREPGHRAAARSPARPTCCDCVPGKFRTFIASLRTCGGKNLSLASAAVGS